MTTRSVTVRIPAQYEDYDDSLSAAAQEYAEDHDLEGYDLEPRWENDGLREQVLLTVPEWTVDEETDCIDTTTLTGESISDADIEDLHAATADDLHLECTCLIALGETDGATPPAEEGTPYRQVLDDYELGAYGLSNPIPARVQAAAREACARAIRARLTRR